MASAIDDTHPPSGVPVSKAAQRANWAAAKGEIEALQGAVAPGGMAAGDIAFTPGGTLAATDVQAAIEEVLAEAGGASVTGLVTADTVADLKAIPPTAGASVYVLGYFAPGDGGGGLFRAEMTGHRETDGGTCFAHTGDLAAYVDHDMSRGDLGEKLYQLPVTDLDFDSFEVVFPYGEMGSPPHANVTVPSHYLHGHIQHGLGQPGLPDYRVFALVNFKTGLVNDRQSHLFNFANVLTTPPKPLLPTIRFRYRPISVGGATAARRWVRAIEGDTVSVRWFGATPTTAVHSFGAFHRIAWAVTTAKRLGYRVVTLDDRVYDWNGVLRIPDGMTLERGVLRVHPDYDPLQDALLAYDAYSPEAAVGQPGGTGVDPEQMVESMALRRIELDGAVSTHGLWSTNPELYQAAVAQNWLQDTPHWCGINLGVHGVEAPRALNGPSFRCNLDDVHIHDTGSAGIQGAGGKVIGNRVRLGNVARNHFLYFADGWFRDLTLYGYYYGEGTRSGFLKVDGLIVEDLANNPYYPAFPSEVVLGLNGSDESISPTPNDPATSPGRIYSHRGFAISNFDWSVPDGWNGYALFGHLGADPVVIRDGVARGQLNRDDPVRAGPGLVRHYGNEPSLASPTPISVENVGLIRRGQAVALWSENDPQAADLTVRNVVETIDHDAPADEPVAGQPAMFFYAYVRMKTLPGQPTVAAKGWNRTRRHVLEGIKTRSKHTFLFTADIQNPAAGFTAADLGPVEVVVRGCDLAAIHEMPIKNPTGTGELAGLTHVAARTDRALRDRLLRFIWEDVTFPFGVQAAGIEHVELMMELSRFRNFRTPSGLMSEQSGSYSANPAGISIVIPTSLFWVPERATNVRFVPTNAAAATALAGASVAFQTSGGAAASWGTWTTDYRSPRLVLTIPETNVSLSFDWHAAVKPL